MSLTSAGIIQRAYVQHDPDAKLGCVTAVTN
jgi:hypothetical protein